MKLSHKIELFAVGAAFLVVAYFGNLIARENVHDELLAQKGSGNGPEYAEADSKLRQLFPDVAESNEFFVLK
jgi:hypothetical protein